ncbi:MAG: CHASE domain-containing protein [Verrucomicrobiae bacterium]
MNSLGFNPETEPLPSSSRNARHPKDAGISAIDFFRGGWWALGILLAGLAVTWGVAHYEKFVENREAWHEFDSVCKEIQSRIEDRLSSHEILLRAGAARFADTRGVSREEWREFAERQKIIQMFPGIQGIGFAQLIPGRQLAQHTLAIRAEGFPNYLVKPEGKREVYSSIIYLEPFSGRNLRAFGYDMLSEPVRRAAMERARDRDEAAFSGRVTLVQETGKDVQAGTLMYVPVYRSGMPHETVAERRAALLGWVYSPYRMNDLMQGILGRWDFFDRRRIRLQIFDGETPAPEALLYDSQRGAGEKPPPPGRMSWQTAVDAAGRRWLLSFSQSGGTAGLVFGAKVWLVLGGGTIISLLLSGLVLSLANTRFHARRLAERMQDKLLQLEAAVEQSLDGIALADLNGHVLFVNKAWADMHGCSVHELIGQHLDVFHNQEQLLSMVGPANALLVESGSFQGEIWHVRKDGTPFATWMTNVMVLDANRTPYRILGIAHDITARKLAEEEMLKSGEEFRTMFEMASIGMAQCDPQTGRWIRVNQKMCEITGYSAAEMLQMQVRDITHLEDRQKDFAEFQRVVRGEIPSYRLEKRYVRKDGALVWVNVNMTVIRDAAGKPIRTMATIEDISARKQTEETLRAETLRRQELEQEVLGIAESEQRRIGHDLHDGICQELTGIQFVAEHIAMRLPEGLAEKELLAKTVEDIRKALLHTRHISHSLSPVVLEKGDLSTALAELAVNTETTFGIACTFACPSPPAISSSGTATHLYRIAQESVQNAIRHGKATSIDIALIPSGANWVLQVADNGTPSEHENKSGRGLQIMHYRASMFAGSLRVQSRENCGTIITCTFSP